MAYEFPCLSDAPLISAEALARLSPAPAINICSRCDAVISLSTPSPETPARPWLCGGCGSVYFAARSRSSVAVPGDVARRVDYDQVIDIATLSFRSRNTSVPRRELNRLLTYFSESFPLVAEKRTQKRYPMALPVIAVPLGNDFRVMGAAKQLTTINVSSGGASLLDIEPCKSMFLALDFSLVGLSSAKAVFEVLRVRPTFSAYEVSGRLVARIGE
jgi:hypothetical protein